MTKNISIGSTHWGCPYRPGGGCSAADGGYRTVAGFAGVQAGTDRTHAAFPLGPNMAQVEIYPLSD